MRWPAVLLAISCLATAASASAVIEIGSSVISCGGGVASSPAFGIVGSVGQPVASSASSASFAISSGLWAVLREPGRLEPGPVPAVFSLGRGFPNPFDDSVTIPFGLPQRTSVDLAVYDVAGRLVRTLVREPLDPGTYSIPWDGRDDDGGTLRSGIYYYRLDCPAFRQTHKLTLLR